MTDCGVVPVPEEPVYGHVWSVTARDWMTVLVLHHPRGRGEDASEARGA